MDISKVLQQIIMELVDKSDSVKVEKMESKSTVVFNIRVAEGDLGKVLGKKGRIITAIRTIFGSIFSKHGLKIIIEVSDK